VIGFRTRIDNNLYVIFVTTIVKDSGKIQEEVSFLSFSGDDGHWGTNWHLKKTSRLEGH
jgi:hypothetical protein